MNSNTWKKYSIKSYVVVVILIVIAIITALSLSSGSPKDVKDDDGDGTQPNAQIVKLLTVTSVTEKCKTTTDQNVVRYDVGALKGVPPRKWSDALSTPLSGGLGGVKSAVCHDPLYGVTVANMLAGLTVDGVKVESLNPWLRPYRDVSKINDKAKTFIPLLDVKSPSTDQVEVAVEKNYEYQELANRVNTLLSRFKVTGTDTLRSVKNWHLAGAGLTVGGLPEVGLDSRFDVKPALVLEVTLKNRCAPVAQIGFNVGDKRPEVFKPPTCKTTSHPTPSHPTTSHPTPSHPTTSHPTPTPTPTPTPEPCVKPPQPGDGVYTYNPGNCTWDKPPQSFDDQQNNNPADQDAQDNSTSGVNTGSTSGAGNGTSSPSNGGTGSAPSGGGSDGSGGTSPDNPPVDTGQGGDNDGSGNGPIVDPG